MDRSVLVVDDDQLICWALKKELSAQGISVHLACTGGDALASFRGNAFPLAFIDIHLPDVNGLDLLSEIRTISRTSDLVILSARATDENIIQAFSRGAMQFIEKPFEFSTIQSVVDSAFSSFPLVRKHRRFLYRMGLRLVTVDLSPEGASRPQCYLSARTVDMGIDGLRIRTDYPLQVGQRIRIGSLDGSPHFSKFVPRDGTAEVVWTERNEDGYVAGIRYLREPTPGRIS